MTMVMYWDGTTRRGPMPLPTTAQKRLDGRGTVSNLQGADWQTRNACGYYEAIGAVASDGMVITATAWPDVPTDGVFTQTIVSEITEAEYAEQQAQAVRDSITAAMQEPIWRVTKKIIYTLAGLHGFTEAQINAQIAQFIAEE